MMASIVMRDGTRPFGSLLRAFLRGP